MIRCDSLTIWTRYVVASSSRTLLSSQGRHSVVSIQRIPAFGSVCANSETYVAQWRYSQRRTPFHQTFSTLVPTRSPGEVMVTCIREPSMTQRFTSNACGFIVGMIHKGPLKCVIEATSPAPSVTKFTDLLPRGRNVETLDTPKHLTSPGCYYRSLPTHFGLDVRRPSARLHQEQL